MAKFQRRKGRPTATVIIPDNYPHPVKARSISETFKKKADAVAWAAETEADIKRGIWRDPRLAVRRAAGGWEARPLREAIDEYRDTITPKKRSADTETTLLQRLARQSFAAKPAAEVTDDDLADYRDERLAAGRAANTVRNELFTVSAVYEWLIHSKKCKTLQNPVTTLRNRKGDGLPSPAPGRERRLRGDEEQRLMAAYQAMEGPDGRQMVALYKVLMDTAMRLGEALAIRASWLRYDSHFIVVPAEHSKTNRPRHVALSNAAWLALTELAEGEPDDAKVFRLTRAQVEYRSKKARKAAKVTDFRNHDLRHEGLSRMSARGADLRTLMRQSGHSTVQTLMRYLNPTPEEQRRRLFGEEVD